MREPVSVPPKQALQAYKALTAVMQRLKEKK